MRFNIVLLFVIFISANAHSYSFTEDFNRGVFWSSFPIVMSKFIAIEGEAGLLERLTRESEQQWEDALGLDIWHFDNNSNSVNFIRWSYNFGEETGYDPSATLAVTIRYAEGRHIVRTEVILNGELPHLRQNFSSILKKTILHELGHTIGLGHTQEAGIMQAMIAQYKYLMPDDIDGGVALIDETFKRQGQTVGQWKSQFSYFGDDENNDAGTCATIRSIEGDGPTGTGQVGFIFSLLLGVSLTMLLGKGIQFTFNEMP